MQRLWSTSKKHLLTASHQHPAGMGSHKGARGRPQTRHHTSSDRSSTALPKDGSRRPQTQSVQPSPAQPHKEAPDKARGQPAPPRLSRRPCRPTSKSISCTTDLKTKQTSKQSTHHERHGTSSACSQHPSQRKKHEAAASMTASQPGVNPKIMFPVEQHQDHRPIPT